MGWYASVPINLGMPRTKQFAASVNELEKNCVITQAAIEHCPKRINTHVPRLAPKMSVST